MEANKRHRESSFDQGEAGWPPDGCCCLVFLWAPQGCQAFPSVGLFLWLHQCRSNVFQGYFDDAKESRVKQSFKQRFKIQESSFKFQVSRFKKKSRRIKIQEKMNSWLKRRNQEATNQDFTREVLKRNFQKPNIAQFCFTKRVFSIFSKLLEYLLW